MMHFAFLHLKIQCQKFDRELVACIRWRVGEVPKSIIQCLCFLVTIKLLQSPGVC